MSWPFKLPPDITIPHKPLPRWYAMFTFGALWIVTKSSLLQQTLLKASKNTMSSNITKTTPFQASRSLKILILCSSHDSSATKVAFWGHRKEPRRQLKWEQTPHVIESYRERSGPILISFSLHTKGGQDISDRKLDSCMWFRLTKLTFSEKMLYPPDSKWSGMFLSNCVQ